MDCDEPAARAAEMDAGMPVAREPVVIRGDLGEVADEEVEATGGVSNPPL
jgi:hypothetical protein